MVRMSHLGKNRGKGTLGRMTSMCKVDEVGGKSQSMFCSQLSVSVNAVD